VVTAVSSEYTLSTKRLQLRPIAQIDLPWYSELRSRDGFDAAESATRLADAVAHWASRGFGKFAIFFDGVPAGLITLNDAGTGLVGIAAEEIDLGWYVLPHLWGQGIAPEGASAVLDWVAAAEIGPLVVYIRRGNTASTRVAEKLGLRRSGDGRARDGEQIEIYRV
jgi:RimJ/RimL family protein N-acetyltransferase